MLLQIAKVCLEVGWAVVVAQLVEQSLFTPEICTSNPVIGRNFIFYQLC